MRSVIIIGGVLLLRNANSTALGVHVDSRNNRRFRRSAVACSIPRFRIPPHATVLQVKKKTVASTAPKLPLNFFIIIMKTLRGSLLVDNYCHIILR